MRRYWQAKERLGRITKNMVCVRGTSFPLAPFIQDVGRRVFHLLTPLSFTLKGESLDW